jgi:4-amino-4-deoxy-L-arabinose transferase-like glycosyltransferase
VQILNVAAWQRVPSLRTVASRRLVGPWSLSLLLVVAYVGVMAWVGARRVVGDYLKETDLYHYYAPDADRLQAGRAPENPFQGPGYPLLLVLASPWSGGNHFTGGKWLALAAATTTALTAAALFRRLLGARTVVPGLLFLLTGADFARYSVQATTDMPFLALAVLAVAVATTDGLRSWARALIAGILTGLAWLVRYNGVFLVPTCLLALATAEQGRDRAHRRLGLAAVFLAAALAVGAPWMVVNHRLHGFPLYNANYLNIAAMAYGWPSDQDGTRPLSTAFHSVGEVVRHDPSRFVAAYFRNLLSTLGNTLGSPLAILPIGILAMAGTGRVLRAGWGARSAALPFSAAVFILLMALTHWESRYFLYVGVCYAGLAALAVVNASDWARERLGAPAQARLVAVTLALFVLVPALVRTPLRVAELLQQQPTELLPAAAWLRSSTPDARVATGRIGQDTEPVSVESGQFNRGCANASASKGVATLILSPHESSTCASVGVPLLTGNMSCGQAENTTTASISARKATYCPGFDTVGRYWMPLPATYCVFWKRLNGHGVSGAVSPIAFSAFHRLSVQLSWWSVAPSCR